MKTRTGRFWPKWDKAYCPRKRVAAALPKDLLGYDFSVAASNVEALAAEAATRHIPKVESAISYALSVVYQFLLVTHSRFAPLRCLHASRKACLHTDGLSPVSRARRPSWSQDSQCIRGAGIAFPRHGSSARLGGNSMPARGKLIVLEGIDGSGKSTQLEMLVRALEARKIAFTQISFPRYNGFFGKLIAGFLNGEFGPLDAVDPHFSALLYAGDRLEAKSEIESNLAAGRAVVADRYIGSNLAHQTARALGEKRAAFLAWLKQLEYQIYTLPVEDLVIYLRVPAEEAHRLVGQKGARKYTNLQRDLLEADTAHLQAASDVYDQLAGQPNWVKIECFDPAARALRAPETIHQDVLAAVDVRVFRALHANR
jgi:dTMP kinase